MPDHRVLITGARDWHDEKAVHRALDSQAAAHGHPNLVVVHGGATGADQHAHNWALKHKVRIERHPADWKKHGKAAGPLRNTTMVERGANVCLAFPGPKSKGTYDAMNKAKKAGIPVKEHRG